MPPDRLDELEDAWQPERPTKERLKRIERSGPPESFPPPSTDTLIRNIRAWIKANGWVLVLLGLTGTGGTVLPWRDWLGLATKADIASEAKRNDEARAKQAETGRVELLKVRRAASDATARVEELESQLKAQKVLLESYQPKRRGR